MKSGSVVGPIKVRFLADISDEDLRRFFEPEIPEPVLAQCEVQMRNDDGTWSEWRMMPMPKYVTWEGDAGTVRVRISRTENSNVG